MRRRFAELMEQARDGVGRAAPTLPLRLSLQLQSVRRHAERGRDQASAARSAAAYLPIDRRTPRCYVPQAGRSRGVAAVRRSTAFALAFVVGFAAYRVALATLPYEPGAVGTCPLAATLDASASAAYSTGPVSFDAATGLPVVGACTFADQQGGINAAYGHWLLSLSLGMASGAAVFYLVRWARRRRTGQIQRSIATLALAMSLGGCAIDSRPAHIVTADAPGSGGCVLLYQVVDVIADATSGTVIKGTGEPLTWPSGYTARTAGSEVEVLDASGRVVLATGQRYRLMPDTQAFFGDGGRWVVSCVEPCPFCELGGGPM
jgi:hypothetical protein